MGTSIELKIGGVSLDYAKNSMGNDYGFLFQEADVTRIRSDGIDYEYYAEHPEEQAELEVAGAFAGYRTGYRISDASTG